MKNINENKVISIVMPVYNTQEFLHECIESILSQTYKNWELLAVDDFSTDNSFDILCQYAKKDNRIQVVKNTAKGIIPALQNAYKASNGKYITRMDSDDIMLENKLETLKGLLDSAGQKNIAVGPVKYFASYEIGAGFQRYEKWLNSLISKGNNFSEIYKECVIPSPSWMCFREDLDAVNAFNPERYPEDYDLVFRFYQAKYNCIPFSETLHLWRDYQHRTSRTDSNYADQSFIDIKLDYFLQLDYRSTKQILIWGAGQKGKRIASLLQQKNIPFQWICDNPKKIGKDIYGITLLDFKTIKNFSNFQSILTVANPAAKIEIEQQLILLGLQSMVDYFSFC